MATIGQHEQLLLFTIAKILRRHLQTEVSQLLDNYQAIQDLKALDDAIGDFRNYIPFKEAP